jgi:ribosomal protein S18 acetylase RimI-like enzyme
MNRIIEEACERGDREMVLEVIEQNDPAVHLYEKYGFEIVRRLIGLIRKGAVEHDKRELKEMDIREASRLLSQFGLPNLPWQLSGESIAELNPPARAYASDGAHIIISNPNVTDIVVWSLFVEPEARGDGLGTAMLKAAIAQFPEKTWHVPALLPEELGKVYERADFRREELSQWQMKLTL